MKDRNHDGQLWDRLYQIVKVEEPIEYDSIRRRCLDVPTGTIASMLSEMTRVRALECDVSKWPKLFYSLAERSNAMIQTKNANKPTLEKALYSALDSRTGDEEKWGALRESGATDEVLTAAIREAFGHGGEYEVYGGYGCKGGKSPQFIWFDDGPRHQAQKLNGKRLLAKVREVMRIGAPGVSSEPLPSALDVVKAACTGTFTFGSESKEAAGKPQINEHGVYVRGVKEIDIPMPKKAGKTAVKISVVQDLQDKLWRYACSLTVGNGSTSGPIMEVDQGYESREEALRWAAAQARTRLESYKRGQLENRVIGQVAAGIAALDSWVATNVPEGEIDVDKDDFTASRCDECKMIDGGHASTCSQYGSVDVVEEDLVRDPEALHQEMLRRYRGEPEPKPESPKCECGETEAQHDGPGGVCGLADCYCCGFTPAVEDWETSELKAPIEYEPTAPATNGYHPKMLQMIPIDQIEPSPTNPRKHFDKDKLQELANSIIEHGLVEPILVRPLRRTKNGGIVGGDIGETLEAWPGLAANLHYQLVAGERRWRAVRLAGQTAIECKVRELDDKAVLEIQFIENLQRSDLSPIEEAEGYKRLLDEHGYTAESLAGKLGKSKSYVYGRLKLCNLPPVAMDMILAGHLSATVGELIGRLPSMEMREEFWEDNFTELGKEWFDAPSYRDVKAEIERGYMKELKNAPFSQTDKKLCPAAGSCKDCHFRTGNNKAEYPDSRADICTKPSCYDLKVEAFKKRKLAEAAKTTGARALTEDESREWFSYSMLRDTPGTRAYLDLDESCDLIDMIPDDDEKTIPTYGELIGDTGLKVEIVGTDLYGKVHRLVDKAEAEKILAEKGINLCGSTAQSDFAEQNARRKAEKAIRQEAAGEICDRIIQSITDNPIVLDSGRGRDARLFLQALALHMVKDADVSRFVAKRHALGNGDHRGALHKLISDRSDQGTLELIVEYLIAEELDWWVRSGETPWPLKRFPICEYFGHDPRKIEKRIAKEKAAEKPPKSKKAAKRSPE